MRLSVVPNVSTKDGTSNKNARLTNMLKESRKVGDMATVRPGLVLDAESSGIGGGLVAFDNKLVSVYGTTLGLDTQAGSGVSFTAYSLGDANQQFQSVDYINGEYLAFSLDIDLGELTTWNGDGTSFSSGSGYGLATGNDCVMTANSATKFVVGTSNASGYGYGKQTEIYKSAIGGSTSFSLSTSDGSYSLQAIRYCGSYFVAVTTLGGSGTKIIYSSNDGVSWSTKVISTDNSFYGLDVSYDGAKWLILGTSDISLSGVSKIKTTTDFVSFSDVALSGAPVKSFQYGTYIGGTYVAYGWTTGPTFYQYISSDGVTWAQQTNPPFKAGGIRLKKIGSDVYMNYNDVPAGHTYSVANTLDGSTWTVVQYNTTADPYSIATDGASNYLTVSGSDTWWYGSSTPATATIPALSTIAVGQYDFAQSTT